MKEDNFLRIYENERYTLAERLLKIFNIIVPSDAEQFGDVSFWQAGMDWDQYKAKGRAAIIRIGQNIWKDSEFETNYAQAKARGIALGGYFFFDGRATPTQQADVIVKAMAGKSFEMELFIDWERNYNGANEGLSNVVSLMQKVEAAGVKCKAVGLYTGYYFFTDNHKTLAHDAYLRQRPLWLAWYAAASAVKVPQPWSNWTHWQYGTPVVDWGQPTAEIDMNRHNGTKAEFEQRYLGGTDPSDNGGAMEIATLNQGLNIRDGVGTAGTVVLYTAQAGNKVIASKVPSHSWYVIDHILLNDGTKKTFPVQAYCSSWDGYFSSVEPYIPPAGGPPVLHIRSDGNEVYPAFDFEVKPK